jgi:hypothetical protein
MSWIEHHPLDRAVKIRYGMLFAPVCWIRKHRLVPVLSGTWADPSGDLCTRCGRFWPGGRR